MRIEIKELLVRAIWGSGGKEEASDKGGTKDSKTQSAMAGSEDELQDMQASIKKMIEQSKER